MPLKKGYSQPTVSYNIREMIRSGKKSREAVAASLASARHYKQKGYSDGGMVDDYEDENEPGMMFPVGGGLPKNESMYEMGRKGPDDQQRSLNEIRMDGEYYPAEVSNPEEMDEAQGFAKALRKKAMGVMSPENYAHGGLVQAGPEEDQRLHGNQPEYINNDGTEEPMSAMPYKPDGLEHRKMGEPSGAGLSAEALEAIRMKKKNRKYGSYDPRA